MRRSSSLLLWSAVVPTDIPERKVQSIWWVIHAHVFAPSLAAALRTSAILHRRIGTADLHRIFMQCEMLTRNHADTKIPNNNASGDGLFVFMKIPTIHNEINFHMTTIIQDTLKFTPLSTIENTFFRLRCNFFGIQIAGFQLGTGFKN